MAKKFTIRKFDGDDTFSYGVFLARDVKGIKGRVLYGQAKPYISGCGMSEAKDVRDLLERRYA